MTAGRLVLPAAICFAGHAPCQDTGDRHIPLVTPLPAYASYVVDLLDDATAKAAKQAEKTKPPAAPDARRDEMATAGEPEPDEEPNPYANTQPNSRRIVRWSVVRTGDTMHVDITTHAGQSGEIWITRAGQVVRPPGESVYILNPTVNDPMMGMETGRYGYPFTNWIEKSHYTGLTRIQGIAALRYRGKFREEGDGIIEEWTNTAWVDAASRRPILATMRHITYAFRHLEPPAVPLRVPPPVQAIFAHEVQRIRDLTAIPPAP